MLEDLLSNTNLPNLHPAVLHFPIALLSLALLTEIAALASRRRTWLDPASVALYLVGAAAAVVTWFTGRMAADSVGLVGPEAQALMSAHSDAALRTVWIFSVVALGRGALEVFRSKMDATSFPVLRTLLLIVALFGCYLLMETADRGGGLVYTHGVAVRVSPSTGVDSDGGTANGLVAPPPGASAASPSGTPTPIQRTADGKVNWTPVPTDLSALGEVVEVEASSGAEVHAVFDSSSTTGLTLEVSGRVFLLLPTDRGDVVLKADLDRLDFVGSIGLVHHFSSADNYESMTLEGDGRATLLSITSEQSQALDEKKLSRPSGRSLLAVSAAGSHLKGFVDGLTVVHGHRDAGTPAGRVGLLFHGRGSIRIFKISVAEATSHH